MINIIKVKSSCIRIFGFYKWLKPNNYIINFKNNLDDYAILFQKNTNIVIMYLFKFSLSVKLSGVENSV